jgi:hypothetical protein
MPEDCDGTEEPWSARVRDWTANHFTISDTGPDVTRLLRKVADALQELGQVEVLDITFCQEVEGSEPEAKMTIYLAFPEADD